MAKRRGNVQAPQNESAPLPQVKINSGVKINVPTGDRRHVGKIREGSISFEVFSKKNLARMPVNPDQAYDVQATTRPKGRRKPRGQI